MKTRICTVCRVSDLATTRTRVARNKNADNSYTYFIDQTGNANGRGAYVCTPCIPTSIKKRAFNRSFKGPIPDHIYTELQKIGEKGDAK